MSESSEKFKEVAIYNMKFFSGQLELIEKAYQSQFNDGDKIDDKRLKSIYPLLFSIHQTGLSISILAGNGGYINSCYILARSMIERIITYLFLIDCDEGEFSNYLAYTRQKGYRIKNRNIIVGDMKAEMKWSGAVDLNKEAELKASLEMFTSKGGREITHWTNKNLKEMLEIIKNNGGIDIGFLMLTLLYIYDDASEALHATLYGSLFDIGIFNGEINEEATEDDFHEMRYKQFFAFFLSIGCSVHSLITGINKKYPIPALLSFSNENIFKVREFNKSHSL